MVRRVLDGPRPGARTTLGGVAVALAYLALAPEFDVPRDVAADPLPAALAGVLAVCWLAATSGMAGVSLLPAALAGLGGLLVAGALAAGDVGAAASGPEAVAFGALGALFSAVLGSPALALSLPAFVGAIDLAGALGGGREGVLGAAAATGDLLALELPRWGGGPGTGALSLAEPAFLGAYVALAARHGLRPVATAIGATLGLVLCVVLEAEADVVLPSLALLGAGFLLANADRLGRLLRTS